MWRTLWNRYHNGSDVRRSCQSTQITSDYANSSRALSQIEGVESFYIAGVISTTGEQVIHVSPSYDLIHGLKP